MPGKHWPKIDRLAEQVIEADRAEKSRKTLAREIGINDSALSVICSLLDLPGHNGRNWDALFQRYPNETATELSRIIDCEPGLVRKAAERRGIVLAKGRGR